MTVNTVNELPYPGLIWTITKIGKIGIQAKLTGFDCGCICKRCNSKNEFAAPNQSGCICKRCNSKNEFAAPNQKDGTYVCFECR